MSHFPFLSCPFFAPDYQKKTLRQAETVSSSATGHPAGCPEKSLFRSVIRSGECVQADGKEIHSGHDLSYYAYSMTCTTCDILSGSGDRQQGKRPERASPETLETD